MLKVDPNTNATRRGRRLASALAAALMLAPAVAEAQTGAACAARNAREPIQAFAIVGSDSAADSRGTVAVSICIVARRLDDGVGGYRGELRYDPAALELVRLERGAGGARFENADDGGRVVFAGVSAEGFVDPLVLRVFLRPRGGVGRPPLELLLHELSSMRGADLAGQARVAASPSWLRSP